jgi:predicted HAD superfamily Cof-like phosphohydrolase
MSNVFRDQAKFMNACGQTVGKRNLDQFDLYLKLILEEVSELQTAVDDNDLVEQLDALIDIMVVTVGAVQSLGVDGEGAWKEVMSTNFAKIDSLTGRVRKREDGKILKPVGWRPPELSKYINKEQGR